MPYLLGFSDVILLFSSTLSHALISGTRECVIGLDACMSLGCGRTLQGLNEVEVGVRNTCPGSNPIINRPMNLRPLSGVEATSLQVCRR